MPQATFTKDYLDVLSNEDPQYDLNLEPEFSQEIKRPELNPIAYKKGRPLFNAHQVMDIWSLKRGFILILMTAWQKPQVVTVLHGPVWSKTRSLYVTVRDHVTGEVFPCFLADHSVVARSDGSWATHRCLLETGKKAF